ncbi:MAG TPA: aromatic ring-hydroxylating dioxygenase subunit alpha [Acidimicrobiia bacterium]|nr:aromatic ring-hydroxylating dioxygenase subunit alpha [Acidimicrobiia bacterium]
MTTIRDAAPGGPAFTGEHTDDAPVGSTIGPVEPRRTPVRVPAERYTSPEWAAREAELLWPRVWQVACTVDHVRAPGDWFEYTCGPLSVLVVRDGDGALRAFQNVCLHRGNELASGCGTNRTEIRCKYHRWCWNLDGTLREVPSRRGFGVIRNEEYGLVPVQVDTWGPLVFVNLDLDAEPLAAFLAPVPAETAWLRTDEYVGQAIVTIPLPCNWKTGIDAFSETYHVQGIHRQMIPSTDDVNGPQEVWDRHGHLNQPYGIPSPRLRDGASDQEIWESFVATQGERVGRPGSEDPGPVPERRDGESVRDLLARLIRERAATNGVDLAPFTDAQVTDLHQFNCFPNISPVFLVESLACVRTRPGTTPDDCFLDLIFCSRAPSDRDPHDAERARPVDVTLDPATADVGAVFNQDIANLMRAQRGLHQPGFTHLSLSREEMRIERLHHNLERYLGITETELTGG